MARWLLALGCGLYFLGVVLATFACLVAYVLTLQLS
jgi:hypothetical protein